MWFLALPGQAEPRLDERQRPARLPAAQQHEGAQVRKVRDQVVVLGGPGDRQPFLTVFLGGGVSTALLKEVRGRGQAPRAQKRLLRLSRQIEGGPERLDSLGCMPACLPELPQRSGQPDAGRG